MSKGVKNSENDKKLGISYSISKAWGDARSVSEVEGWG